MAGPVRTFDYDEARRLRAAGETLKSIAAKLGVSRSAVIRAVLDPYSRALHDDAKLRRIRTAGYPTNSQWLHPCRCGHLGRWHRGGLCRISECGCESFREDTIPYHVDAAWMGSGRQLSSHRVRSKSA